MIILISGYPISGKTTLAHKIMELLADYNPKYLGTDDERIESALDTEQRKAKGQFRGGKHFNQKRMTVYQRLLESANEYMAERREQSEQGVVVFDGTYRYRKLRDDAVGLARAYDSPIVLIKVACEDAGLVAKLDKERVARGDTRSFARMPVYRKVKARFNHPTPTELKHYNAYFEITSPLTIDEHICGIVAKVKELL